jgi:hypothetical protein
MIIHHIKKQLFSYQGIKCSSVKKGDFPDIQAKFLAVLHSKQWEIFQEVLYPSLLVLKREMENVILGQDNFGRNISLFDKKLEELLQGIQILNDLVSEDEWLRFFDKYLMLMVFVFYRILYRNLLAYLNKGVEETDNYLLIKRISPKLFSCVGSQYWRLYEFSTIIYGNVDELKLNADFILPLTTMGHHFTRENPPQVTATDNEDYIQHSEKFLNWVEKHITQQNKQFKINTGGYIFAATLKYGTHAAFIPHQLLDDYCQDSADIQSSKLIQALQALNKLSKPTYQVKTDEKIIPLFKLTLCIDLFEETNPVTILEKPHAN